MSLLNARICVSGPIVFTAVEQTSHETYFALSKTLVPLSADIITAEKKEKKTEDKETVELPDSQP